MGRKKKELKKLEKDDQAERVDLTESIEPIELLEPVAPSAQNEPSELSEPGEPSALATDAVPPAVEKSAEEHAATDFKAKTTLAQDAFRKTFDFVKDQKSAGRCLFSGCQFSRCDVSRALDGRLGTSMAETAGGDNAYRLRFAGMDQNAKAQEYY